MIGTKLQFVTEGESLSVRERKERLRAYMKERRGQNENRDLKEHALIENFRKMILETGGAGIKRSYFIYLSFSSEAPTDGLIETLLKDGADVYCPKTEKGVMTAVAFGEDFSLLHNGIREPVGQAFDGETDYVVLPLLAVDKHGNRLGYGGGCYDRYLAVRKKTKRIAYCYDFQLLDEIPSDSFDESVDAIVTERQILYINDIRSR